VVGVRTVGRPVLTVGGDLTSAGDEAGRAVTDRSTAQTQLPRRAVVAAFRHLHRPLLDV